MVVILLSSCMAGDFRKYVVHYVPLDVDYYAPPSREDIIKWGVRFEIYSPVLDEMYEVVNAQNGEILSSDDRALIRILIINNDNREIFITQDKTIISFQNNKKYTLNSRQINDILTVITEIGDDLLRKISN